MNIKLREANSASRSTVATEPNNEALETVARLSRSNLHRNYVLQQFGNGALGVERAAKLLRISGSQVRRLCKKNW